MNHFDISSTQKKYSRYYLLSIGFLFLIAMQYFQDNVGGHGLGLPFNSISWIGVAFIIAVASWHWLKTKRLVYSDTDLFLLIVFACLAIPLLWADSPWRQTVYDNYLGIIAFISIIIAHRQFDLDDHQRAVFWLIVVCGVVFQCFVGVYQFFYADQLHIINHYRLLGTIQQANVYASLIATGLAISCYQLLSKKLPRFFKVVHFVMVFFAGLLVLFTQSRTGIVGAFLALFFLFLLFRKERKVIKYIVVLIISGLMLGIFVKQIVQDDEPKSLTAAGYRTVIYKVSVELIKEAPILGHGVGRFAHVYAERQAALYKEQPEAIYPTIEAVHLPHNEILYWWIEGGILPIIALLVFAVYFSVRVWRLGSIDNKALWLCTIPIVLHSQTEYPLYHSVPSFMLLGLLISSATPGRTFSVSTAQFTLIPNLLVSIMPFLVTIFMLTNLHTTWLLHKYYVSGVPDYLLKILNPIGQLSTVNLYRSQAYLRSGNAELILLAEDVLMKEVSVRPTHTGYWVLHHVQKTADLTDKAAKTFDRGGYLYPASDKFVVDQNKVTTKISNLEHKSKK